MIEPIRPFDLVAAALANLRYETYQAAIDELIKLYREYETDDDEPWRAAGGGRDLTHKEVALRVLDDAMGVLEGKQERIRDGSP